MQAYSESWTNSASVPLDLPIFGGLVEGSSIHVHGEVFPDADGFIVDLHYGSDIALHFDPRFGNNESVVHNTRKECQWGLEGNQNENPFQRGQSFALQILFTLASYKISVNGNPFSEYEHRIPFKSVDSIKIYGSMKISALGFKRFKVNVCMCKGRQRREADHRTVSKSEFAALPGSLKVPYKSIIDGGLKPGKVILIQGVLNPEGMEIFLRHKTGIAFYYGIRVNESVIVCNSYEDGKWGDEERYQIKPIDKGEMLQLSIICRREHYEVFVNGEQTQTFNHRFSKLEEVDVVEVSGNVELSLVQQ
ncbi:galectin-9-like [Danio aesculapii]|uniref:galectin-9-like n=1 Tax=Danio aesculapii TaxID=1142201 RepID=UPI0024BF7954|nr:galectin-9-like [Danio aesculapii]